MISYANNTFLGIPLEVYSHILAVAVLLLLVLLVIHIVSFFSCKWVRTKTLSLSYFTFLGMIGFLALLSTLGALVYQWGFLLVVCELCWWQRIFMFPIEFITLSGIVKKSRGIHLSIGLLASVGTFFAGYHYILHFKSWVLKQENVMSFTSCDQGGILPSCTDPSGVLIFEFLTIPFMALVVFLVILWLVFLASQRDKMEKSSI